MSDKPTEQRLAKFFRHAWTIFVDGGGFDGFELQEALEASGLAEWRACTAAEAERFECDIDEGDPALFLTDEGRRVMSLARETQSAEVES